VTILTNYQAQILFVTAPGLGKETAWVSLMAENERDVRRKLAAMGIASEAVPARYEYGDYGDPVYSDDVIDVATGRIETVLYEPMKLRHKIASKLLNKLQRAVLMMDR
jgi:hypothetical protein